MRLEKVIKLRDGKCATVREFTLRHVKLLKNEIYPKWEQSDKTLIDFVADELGWLTAALGDCVELPEGVTLDDDMPLAVAIRIGKGLLEVNEDFFGQMGLPVGGLLALTK